jgi:hypothetical protein
VNCYATFQSICYYRTYLSFVSSSFSNILSVVFRRTIGWFEWMSDRTCLKEPYWGSQDNHKICPSAHLVYGPRFEPNTSREQTSVSRFHEFLISLMYVSLPTHPLLSHRNLYYPSYPIPSYPIPSYLIPPHPILYHPIPSHPTPSHPTPSHPIPSHPIPSHLISSYHILSYPIALYTIHLIPSYPIPSYPIPSHPILSYPIPSYPIPSHPIPSHPVLSYSIPSYPISTHRIQSCPIPSYPILLDLITLLKLCEKYNIWSTSLCNVPVLLLLPVSQVHIFSSALCSQTLSICVANVLSNFLCSLVASYPSGQSVLLNTLFQNNFALMSSSEQEVSFHVFIK